MKKNNVKGKTSKKNGIMRYMFRNLVNPFALLCIIGIIVYAVAMNRMNEKILVNETFIGTESLGRTFDAQLRQCKYVLEGLSTANYSYEFIDTLRNGDNCLDNPFYYDVKVVIDNLSNENSDDRLQYWIADLDSNTRVSSSIEKPIKTARDDDWYFLAEPWAKGVMNTKDIYLSNSVTSLESGEVIVTLSKSIRNKDGIVLGAIGVDISVTDLLKTSKENIKYFKEGVFYLVSEEDRYIYNPDTTLLNLNVEDDETLAKLYRVKDHFKLHQDGEDYYACKYKLTEFNWTIVCGFRKAGVTSALFNATIEMNMCMFSVIVSFVLLLIFILARVNKTINKYMDEIEMFNPEKDGEKIATFNVYELDTIGNRINELYKMYQNSLKIIEKYKNGSQKANTINEIVINKVNMDLKENLNKIVCTTDEIIRGDISDEAKEKIYDIRSAVDWSMVIIDKLADFQMLEDGSFKLLSEEYYIQSIFSDIINSIRDEVMERNIEFISDIDNNLPFMLYGDSSRVRQIFISLLVNTVRRTEKGHMTLKVGAESLSDEQVLITFSVSSSSKGFNERELDYLLTPYDSLENEESMVDIDAYLRDMKYELILIRSLCRVMGGDLICSSEYGKGVIYVAKVVQKIVDSRKILEFSTAPIFQNVNNVSFKVKGIKALIVDDNIINLKIISSMLKAYNVECDLANNGMLALDKIKSNRYSLVFMDHMMPIMDGADVVQKLRQFNDVYFKSLIVISLTANNTYGIKEKLLKDGFNDIIFKPLDKLKLEETLKKWLPSDVIVYSEIDNENTTDDTSNNTNLLKDFDVELGMSKCGNNREFYVDLLMLFYEKRTSRSEKLKKYLENSLFDELRKEIKILRETVSTIGSINLSLILEIIEDELTKQEYANVQRDCERMFKIYDDVLGYIRQFLIAEGRM